MHQIYVDTSLSLHRHEVIVEIKRVSFLTVL